MTDDSYDYHSKPPNRYRFFGIPKMPAPNTTPARKTNPAAAIILWASGGGDKHSESLLRGSFTPFGIEKCVG